MLDHPSFSTKEKKDNKQFKDKRRRTIIKREEEKKERRRKKLTDSGHWESSPWVLGTGRRGQVGVVGVGVDQRYRREE
jgi:hypothetical protein